MLAKVIAHGADRGEALDRLAAALDDTVVLGVTTNLRFLRWLVREPAVRDGQARIDTLDRIWPPDDWAARTTSRRRRPGPTPRACPRAPAAGGSTVRLGPASSPMTASERDVDLGAPSDGDGPGEPLEVAVAGGTAHVDVDGRSVGFRLAPPPDVDRAARAAIAHHAGGPAEVDAPMPGSVLAVHVAVGAAVEAGDPIVTLEAMKMEHVVAAPFAGTVAELRVRRADQVARGQTLAVLEP